MRPEAAGAWLALLPILASAAPEPATNMPPPAATGTVAAVVDREHRRASHFVLRTIDRFDTFLHNSITSEEQEPSQLMEQFYGDRRSKRDTISGSYVTLTPEVTFAEDPKMNADVGFSVRLKLRRLTDRLEFFAERFDEEEEDMLEQVMGRIGRPVEGERAEEGGAGLRYRLPDYLSLKPSVSAAIAFKPMPVLRLKLRGRLIADLGRWQMRLSETLFWKSDDGVGERTQLDFSRRIGEATTFRSGTGAEWSEVSEGIDLGQAFVLSHALSHRRRIAFRVGVAGHTEPSAIVDSYSARVTWRQRVYRDWLFMELEPGVDFPNDRDFRATPLMTIRFDIILGAVKEDP